MMQKIKIKYLFFIILFILLDQGAKTFFIGYLKTIPGYNFEIFPFFDIVYSWNYGISFGLFQEYYQYSNYTFMAINSLIIIYLVYMLTKPVNIMITASLICIIGGAIGNLIDRLFRGAVFDFVYLHYHDFHFPVFNLADSFITIGAILFLLQYLNGKKTVEVK